jgi:hypothetical protein
VSTIKTRKAAAGTILIVTYASTRAVTSSFVTITVEGIGARWAFLKLARRTSVPSITEATYMFHGIPRGSVCASSLTGKVLFRPACATIIAVIGTCGALAGNAIVSSKAGT